jgi:branched-chain amino acid aminotransferase
MQSAERVYLNGELVPRDAARVSAFDRGFLYGDGFFETTRIEGGAAVFLDRHLRRMAASCLETGFGRAPDAGALTEGVRALIAANGVRTGYLRISVSRGPYDGHLTRLQADVLTVLAEARTAELAPLDGAAPISVVRSAYGRDQRSPIVRHKSLSYQLNVLALTEGRAAGADEVYFLNTAGELAEGAISNLFFVRDGTVRTPAVTCGLLPGVTRQVVLELCEAEGVPSEVGRYGEQDLLAAEEAFCTNSLRGLMPVARILGEPARTVPGGPLLGRLQRAYAARARSEPTKSIGF